MRKLRNRTKVGIVLSIVVVLGIWQISVAVQVYNEESASPYPPLYLHLTHKDHLKSYTQIREVTCDRYTSTILYHVIAGNVTVLMFLCNSSESWIINTYTFGVDDWFGIVMPNGGCICQFERIDKLSPDAKVTGYYTNINGIGDPYDVNLGE
jgi:hypothetical protein